MWTMIILLVHSTLIVIFLSFIIFSLLFFLMFSLRSHQRNKHKMNVIGVILMVQFDYYEHPLQRTILTRTHGKRQELVSFPRSQEDR